MNTFKKLWQWQTVEKIFDWILSGYVYCILTILKYFGDTFWEKIVTYRIFPNLTLRSMLCSHKGTKLTWRYNYYGDRINLADGKRSCWKCEHCQILIDKPELHNPARQMSDGDVDDVYHDRNLLVIALAATFSNKSFWIDDPNEDDWAIVFIDFGNESQMSWHVPKTTLSLYDINKREGENPWDGHDLAGKRDRLLRFIRLRID